MATAQALITQALKLAGNTSIPSADALDWLQNFLDAEYARKYPWQRKTVTISFGSGAVSNTANWDTTFLDTYQHKDGSCGRWQDGSTIIKLWEWEYREYIARPDRLTATGPPRRLVADQVGATWYVYPKTDKAYSVTVDIYQKPAALALGSTPLWSTYAPDAILVQAIKCAALFHQDEQRYVQEMALLHGDARLQLPGMLATYRRRVMADEGIVHQSALDPRVFLPVPDELAGDWQP